MSTLPLYLGSKRSQIEWMSGARSLLTMIPVIPRLPGRGELRPGSYAGGAQVGDEVLLEVRDRRRFEFLQVAEFVHLLRHPVGDDEEAAAARFALPSSGRILAKNSSLELTSSTYLTETPVSFSKSATVFCRCRAASWRSSACPTVLPSTFTCRLRAAAVSGVFDPAAAGRPRADRAASASSARPIRASARSSLRPPHSSSSYCADAWRQPSSPAPPRRSRTCMCSGSQLSATRAPPPGSRWRSASSALGTSTVIRTSSPRSTTIWVAVPR